jgi:DNA end-binding protein Ku
VARPLWCGMLSFGLVTIPIGVHPAVRDLGPHFHLLRARDGSRIRYEKVAARDGQPVSKEDLVKGYEYEKGRYVVLTPQDFEQAALHKDRVIEVIDFVKAEEALFREALTRSKRIGIGTFVMRDRQY